MKDSGASLSFKRLVWKHSATAMYSVHKPTKRQLLISFHIAFVKTLLWRTVMFKNEGVEQDVG
jgi:hypothetical protein